MSVETVFAAAAQRPSAERAEYLDQACGGDADLRQRVERLLKAHDIAGEFLESPAEQNSGTIDYAPIAEKIGSRIGPYILRERIGEGGFGLVFVADQIEPVKRKVALKVVKPGMDSQQVIARFEAERQALALMDHPNIAKVLDAGATDSGRPYFVMELVRGIPITDYCDQNQLPLKDRLELFVTVCQAIQHAHQKGVIHRDIKPSNVLVTSHDGRPVAKVIDFGVAKAIHQQLTDRTIYTNFAQMIGTPLYMSPEQAEMSGLDVDTRSDVYSLGVLLYELLTGTTPLEKKRFREAAYDEIRRLIREEEPPKPSTRLSSLEAIASIAAQRHMEPSKLSKLMRGDLDWITMKALEKDRTRRYETANGLARDIQRHLGDEPVEACPPSASYRLRKFAKKNRAALSTAMTIALLLAAGATISTWQAVRARESERVARTAAEAERQAKQDAEVHRRKAEAKQQEAERNLAFAKKGNEILGSVFAELDPQKIAESGRPLQDVLRENLGQAAKDLEGSAVGDPKEVAAMQNTLGTSLMGLGEAALAVQVFQKSLETRQTKLGADHPDTIASAHNLASAYSASGQTFKALPLLEEIVQKQKAKLGSDHRHTLIGINNLAQEYLRSGQPAKALPLFEESLQKRKATLGPDDPDTLTSLNNLAATYRDSRQFAKAVPLFEEALGRLRSKLGPDHPNTLISMNNLAESYKQNGQPAKAVPLFEEALQKQKTILGADHPDTLVTMANLADTYRLVGRTAEAIRLFEETLSKVKARLGPDRPVTYHIMTNLGLAYQASGQTVKALALFEEALEKRKIALGPDHHYTLNSMDALADAYRKDRQFAKALPLHEEALAKRKAKLGDDHSETLTTMSNLALAYSQSGDFAKALPLNEETLKRSKATLGADHPSTLSTMFNLGSAYAKAKQGEKAAAVLNDYLAAIRKRMPQNSVQLGGVLSRNSLVLLACDQYVAAEPLLRECLAIREKTEPDAWTTFNTQSTLGLVLLRQKKFAEAEPCLIKGYEGLKARELAIPPAFKANIPEALDRLVELDSATNKPEEVKKWQTERAKYPPNQSKKE